MEVSLSTKLAAVFILIVGVRCNSEDYIHRQTNRQARRLDDFLARAHETQAGIAAVHAATAISMTTTTNTFMQQRNRDEALVGGIVAGAVSVAGAAGLLGGLLGEMTTTMATEEILAVSSRTFAPQSVIASTIPTSMQPSTLQSTASQASSQTLRSINETTSHSPTEAALRVMADEAVVSPMHSWTFPAKHGWIMPTIVLCGCFLVLVLVTGSARLFVMSQEKRSSRSNRSIVVALGDDPFEKDAEKSSVGMQESHSDVSQAGSPMCKPLVTEVGTMHMSHREETWEDIELVFRPGKIGIQATGDRVDSVREGSQAEDLGVRVGWHMLKVNGAKYTGELLRAAIGGRSSFSIVFRVRNYWE